jgi:hypothetical protein
MSHCDVDAELVLDGHFSFDRASAAVRGAEARDDEKARERA